MAFFKLELSETVVRGMTVSVEAANEEEARAKVDGGDWDEEVESDPHETVSREIDSVEPMTADELAQAAFVTECQTCGKVSNITGDDFCDCPSVQDHYYDREASAWLCRTCGENTDACECTPKEDA